MRNETQTINFETENSGDWNIWKLLGTETENWKTNDEANEDDSQCIFLFSFSLLRIRICYQTLLICETEEREHASENSYNRVLGRAEGEKVC